MGAARGKWRSIWKLLARSAAHDISAELCEAYADAPPASEEDIAALEHLTLIRTVYLVLALFARHMMFQLAGRGESNLLCAEFTPGIARAMIAKAHPPTYLDSS